MKITYGKIRGMWLIALVALLSSRNVSATIEEDSFTDEEFKFSVEKPASWNFTKDVITASQLRHDGSAGRSTRAQTRVAFWGDFGENGPRLFCAIDEIQGGIQDPYKRLVDELDLDVRKLKYFAVLENARELRISSMDAAHAVASSLTKINDKFVRQAYSSWFILTNERFIRLQCNSGESFHLEAAVIFEKIALSIKVR